MPTISITRAHKLARAEARAAAEKIARDLKERFDLACEWDGDELSFARPGLSGSMHVGQSNVQLDVQLGFLLIPLKGPIEREIDKELDALFGKS